MRLDDPADNVKKPKVNGWNLFAQAAVAKRQKSSYKKNMTVNKLKKMLRFPGKQKRLNECISESFSFKKADWMLVF